MGHSRVDLPLYRYLDTIGNGTGSKNANVDGSVTPVDFIIKPSTTSKESFKIATIIVYIEDTAGFTAEEYGNLGVALTNGVTIKIKDNGGHVILDITDGLSIKHNSEWGQVADSIDHYNYGVGSANEAFGARFTFASSGKPLTLRGANSEYLAVTINDSCTGLIQHHFMVHGEYLQ